MASDQVWWVYCVVPRSRELPGDLVGLSGGSPIAVTAGDLTAVASEVPLEEYGEEPLREHLNDLDWLERMARTHETVLERMLAGGAVVPVRVCTIYSSEDQIRTMLEERADAMGETLARLEGRSEWGVKAVVDRAKLESHTVETHELDTDVDGLSQGASYIARKRLAKRVREESERVVSDAMREAHSRLARSASDWVVLPAQSRELSGHVGEMVLNCAYLVTESDRDVFASLVHELDTRYDECGFTLELTGPWPAYHFAGGVEG